MPDTTIRINVTGQAELAAAIQLIQQFNGQLTNVNPKMGQLSATAKIATQDIIRFNTALRSIAPSMDELERASKRSFYTLEATAAVFGKFYLVGQVFNSITTAINESKNALVALNYEAARAVPPMQGGDTPANRQLLQAMMARGAIRGGQLTFQDLGEGAYQLSTFIQKPGDLISAFDDNVKLLVGTLGDARDVTRLTIQLYQQFGDSMDKSLDPAEKMHRITELLAGAMKDANSEINEIAQGLKYLGPIATTVNMPLEDTVAAIVALSTVGHAGRMAGTETAAILTNLITKYDSELGGIQHGDKVYKFDRKYKTGPDGTQQFDFAGTVADIASRARSLPSQAEQTEYLKVIGGSMNAVRALGAFAPQTLDALNKSIENSTNSIRGQRKELDSLRDTMEKTFANKAAESWKTVLVSITGVLDQISRSPVFKQLGDLMDVYTREVGQSLDNSVNAAMYANNAQELNRTRTHRALRTHGLVSGLVQRINEAGTNATVTGGVTPVRIENGKIRFGGTDNLAKFIADSSITSEIDDRDANELVGILRQKGIVTTEPAFFGLGSEFVLDIEKLRGFELESKWDYRGALGTERGRPPATNRAIKKYDGPPTVTGSDDDAKRKAEEAKRKRIDWLRKQIEAIEAKAGELVHRRGYDAVTDIQGMRPRYARLMTELAQLTGDTADFVRLGNRSTRLDYQIEALLKQQADDRFTIQRDNFNNELEIAAQNGTIFDEYFDREAYDVSVTGVQRARARFDKAGALQARREPYLSLRGRRREAFRSGNYFINDSVNIPFIGDIPLTAAAYDALRTAGLEAYRRQIDRADEVRMLGVDINAPIAGLRTGDYAANLYQIQATTAAKQARIADLEAYAKSILPADADSEQKIRETTDEINRLKDEIDRLGFSLKTLNSGREVQRFRQRLEDIDIRYSQEEFQLGLAPGRMYGETTKDFQRRQLQQLQGMVGISSSRRNAVGAELFGGLVGGYSDETMRDLQLRYIEANNTFLEATKRFKDGVNDFANAERDIITGSVKGIAQNAILDIARGRGNVGSAIGGLASGIIDQFIIHAIDPYLDVFAGAVADQVLALERNTAALTGQPLPEKTGGGASKTSGRGKMPSDLMLGIGAYGIFNDAYQSGNPASGALSGIISGGAMTGWNPLGMAVGGVVGLLGGIFGGGAKKKTPQEIAAERSPAFYNTPDDFVYAAYRWRATGGKDDSLYMQDLQAKYRPITETAPVFNVYIDGVKSSVEVEVASQVSSGRRSNTNVYMDYHQPK